MMHVALREPARDRIHRRNLPGESVFVSAGWMLRPGSQVPGTGLVLGLSFTARGGNAEKAFLSGGSVAGSVERGRFLTH